MAHKIFGWCAIFWEINSIQLYGVWNNKQKLYFKLTEFMHWRKQLYIANCFETCLCDSTQVFWIVFVQLMTEYEWRLNEIQMITLEMWSGTIYLMKMMKSNQNDEMTTINCIFQRINILFIEYSSLIHFTSFSQKVWFTKYFYPLKNLNWFVSNKSFNYNFVFSTNWQKGNTKHDQHRCR